MGASGYSGSRMGGGCLVLPPWMQRKTSIVVVDLGTGSPFIIVVMISSWGSRKNLLEKVVMLEATHKVTLEAKNIKS